MKTYSDIGVQVPQVQLPKPGTDLGRWAVIACDQFTSQPEYWQKVEQYVDGAPSTLNLVLPEVFLELPGETERIQHIQSYMRDYLDDGILQSHDGMIYVERSVAGRRRRGILLCLDLERYDFARGSTSLIRATEGTIVERLPPRMRIRQDALLELPHIMVLIDDPMRSVIEPLEAEKSGMERLYDFDLMLDSGHLRGYAVDQKMEGRLIENLRKLAEPEVFAQKYGVSKDTPVLLFAMGDGNHSFATAKAIWEKKKPLVGLDHPSRFALIEIENVHDEGLVFEPIHRVLFGLKNNIHAVIQQFFAGNIQITRVANAQEMLARVDHSQGLNQTIGIVNDAGGAAFGIVEINNPPCNLPVGTLQTFLDSFIRAGGADKIDYVHGEDVVCNLGTQAGNAGFYLPCMKKSDLFKTVILDGALPRKTFSMGEAREKRFYMEARKIA
jgi:hypothetical protein